MSTIWLLQCLAGLPHNFSGFDSLDDKLTNVFNKSGDNHNGIYGHPQWVSNGTGTEIWNSGTSSSGTTWLRHSIKSKLVPTICVVGILGNLLTLVVLTCQRLRAGPTAERKVSIWLQALAVSDLLLCVSLLPHGLMTYEDRLVYTSLSFQLLYKAYGTAIINNFILTSTWLTVAMSFSRYLAVCYPLSSYHNLPLSTDSNDGGCRHVGTRFKAGVIFVVSFVFNLPRFFKHRLESHDCRLGPHGAQQKVFALNFNDGSLFHAVYVWLYFVVAIIVPLMLLAFYNVRLVGALYQSQKMRRRRRETPNRRNVVSYLVKRYSSSWKAISELYTECHLLYRSHSVICQVSTFCLASFSEDVSSAVRRMGGTPNSVS